MNYSFVASAQNKAYCGWMAMLFAHSIRRVHDSAPIIVVVHGDLGLPLEPEFRLAAERADATIVRAIDYEYLRPDVSYMPWNSAGTLIHAAPVLETELAVICEVDFVHLRQIDFTCFDVDPGRLAMDYCDYMNVEEGRRHDDLALETAAEVARRDWLFYRERKHPLDRLHVGRRPGDPAAGARGRDDLSRLHQLAGRPHERAPPTDHPLRSRRQEFRQATLLLLP
jgi:hypothetical protein